MEDSLYDVESMRRFAGMDLESIPDETTLLKFRHFLEAHRLTEALFRLTKRYLSERGLLLHEGTIVDASIISAPSSTKNRDRQRDPEVKQTSIRQCLVCRYEDAYRHGHAGPGTQCGGDACCRA